MSSTVTVKPAGGVRGIGLVSIIAGIIFVLAGGATWFVISDQLSAENITVSDDASFLAGRHVNGPLTAYAQADVINEHALAMSDGQTYAELPQDDERRATVMNASFLRASLFTSVVAFGVSALVVGLGLLFILVGIALRRLGRGRQVAVEAGGLTSGGNLSDGTHRPPAHAAPAAPVAPPVTPEAPPVTPASSARAAAVPEQTYAPPTDPQAPVTPPADPTAPGAPGVAEPPADPTPPQDPGAPPR